MLNPSSLSGLNIGSTSQTNTIPSAWLGEILMRALTRVSCAAAASGGIGYGHGQ
jgi:hypothetical protein